MIIDMRNYGLELGYWVKAFKPFVDYSSQNALMKIQQDFEDGCDNHPKFRWETKKPIRSIMADAYDSPGKHVDRVCFTWAFHADFTKGDKPKKNPLWSVSEMVTQVEVFALDPEERKVLHFHQDLKHKAQLGPHVHMQISEDFLNAGNGIKLGVPRFPGAAILPTDCLDLVLSEFFPEKWPMEQVGLQGIGTLRQAQRSRFERLAAALHQEWLALPARTPVARTQNCFMPTIQLA